jgi:hypothetical protein
MPPGAVPQHKAEAAMQKYSAVLPGIQFDAASEAYKPPALGKMTSSTSFDLNFYVGREEKFWGNF